MKIIKKEINPTLVRRADKMGDDLIKEHDKK
jgi:hypothetical protein